VRLFRRAPSIEPAAAAELIRTKHAILVDVRQPGEWDRGHIKEATHVPLAQLSRRLQQLPRDRTIITVCQSGHRSARAARTLTRTGHDAHNLRGGMNAVRARLAPSVVVITAFPC